MLKKIYVTRVLNTPAKSGTVYEVTKMVNSTIFQVSDHIKKPELNVYCEDTEWTVIIT